MFDIGATELLLVAMVALIVIGPKDLPIAMRTAGRWMGQLRKMTGHFRVGIDAMIRDAEIEEQEKIWAEKNAEIMRKYPNAKPDEANADDTEGEPDAGVEQRTTSPEDTAETGSAGTAPDNESGGDGEERR